MATLLVVEDNDMVLDLMREWLARQKFKVIFARDGAQGIALAQSERPDLVLLDLSLPVKDGWTVAREIKADPEISNTPIIAVTANALRGDREKALAAGCDDYESKPFNLDRLLTKILRYLKE